MPKKLLDNLTSLLGFVLLGISLAAIHHELRHYNYRDIVNTLTALPASRLYSAIGLSALGYGISIYDYLAFRYIGHSIAFSKSFFTGFISSAATNTVGFAFLTGSAIRYRFYSTWGVSAFAIAQVIVFENISFWLGLLAVSGVMFLSHPLEIPIQLKLPLSVRPLGIIFLLLVAAYLLGSIISRKPLKIRGREFRFPSLQISLAMLGISSMDWIVAAAVLYVLLPSPTPISFMDFLGIFLLAMTGAVVSNVPGGLGVFEGAILLLLSSKIPATTIFGTLLAYRGVYYFLPLGVATALMGLYEIRTRLRRDSRS
ncbi:MAG TPA: lysylphosphatidylglycerol synthase domain-containing protein [Coleofasciculaceae cyanobacterium]|jgi:hypothetical protein